VTDQNTSETENDVTETASDEQPPSSAPASVEEDTAETGSEAPASPDAAAATGAADAQEASGDSVEDSSDASDASDDADSDADGSSDVDRLENEGDIAADYLEELLDIADLDGDLDMDVEGDRASVSIVGGDVSTLIGRNGEVLEALQELTRLAVYRETGERSRLMLDISGYRAEKREQLVRLAEETGGRVESK